MPGRSEYLNEKLSVKRTSSISDRVSAKSASVSVGKPTIRSVVSAIPGRAARSRAIVST